MRRFFYAYDHYRSHDAGFGTDHARARHAGQIVGTPLVTQSDGDQQLTINPGANVMTVVDGVVAWWLSMPTVNQSYFVHVTVTTNQGRASTRHIQIIGVDR